MPHSLLLRAKRAFVSDLAGLPPSRQESPPRQGRQQEEIPGAADANESWDTARQGARPAGNPALSEGQLVLLSAQSGQYRVHLVYLYKPADLEAQTTRGPGR